MLAPLLPACWQSSYVSYFCPQRPEDRVTSGYAWFDYERGVSRIDGFVNPWDERTHGYRLWVSEIHWFGVSCRRVRFAYTGTTEGLGVRRLADLELASTGPALPRELLRTGAAAPAAPVDILGRAAIPWRVAGPRATTVYACTRTGAPLRVCVEKQPGHLSVRDFLTLDQRPIAAERFEPVPAPEPTP